MGADIRGLGTMLHAPSEDIIVLETGNPLLATTLAGEWVFWQTGTIDFLTFTLVAGDRISIVVVGWRRHRARPSETLPAAPYGKKTRPVG